MCFHLSHVQEDKEQGALKLHEKKKSKTKSMNHIGKNPLYTHCRRRFSIYRDGTQGEVTVWLDPQVLEGVKRFFFHSEHFGSLA